MSLDPLFGVPTIEPYAYAKSNPVEYTDPSGKILCLSTPGLGILYHAGISRHFVATGPGPDSYLEPMTGRIETARVANRSMSTILFLRGGGSVFEELLDRPDLVQRARREFWEIKPDHPGGIISGRLDLAHYQTLFEKFDPFAPWAPGYSYQPNFMLGAEPFTATVRAGEPGLILYCPSDRLVEFAVARVALSAVSSLVSAVAATALTAKVGR